MARTTKPRLGRGLSSLISEPVEVQAPTKDPEPARINDAPAQPAVKQYTRTVFQFLPIPAIVPSRFQPRRVFDEVALQQLATSITNAGVMAPIAVRAMRHGDDAPAGAAWEIVAGERRWRAAQIAGLDQIPAVVVEATDREAAEWGIIENVQREDLNPMESAHAYRNLQGEFGLTQSEIAQRVGVDRSTVANIMRLTELEPSIQSMIESGALTLGHAKALLAAPSGKVRESLAVRAHDAGWSVRALETAAKQQPSESGGGVVQPAQSNDARAISPNVTDLEKRLGEHLGTRVRVRLGASKKKGRIEIEFYDLDQFDGLLQTIGFRENLTIID